MRTSDLALISWFACSLYKGLDTLEWGTAELIGASLQITWLKEIGDVARDRRRMEESLFKDSETGPLHLTHPEGAVGSVWSHPETQCLLVEGTDCR